MGTVWLAQHLTLDVRCAVKFMTGEATSDPSFGARFAVEARAIAQLSSPHVVRILDHDTHEGTPFIAMECLQGEDLGARIKRLGRLDASATYRIVSQVANGLAKAHAAGIVHRDLKPENVFIAQDDDWEGGEVAKLLDFGVAKMTGLGSFEGATRSTQAGSLVGTPAYMSPEQARGVEVVDHRSDLWSLAVVAFECLTGKLPFDGPALGEIFAKILCEPLPVPSEVHPICTTAFDRWWIKAAARNPEYRFSSARDLVDALGRALGTVETPVGVRDTLRAVGCEAEPTTKQRGGRARFVAAALVLAVAPLMATVARGGIEGRLPLATASGSSAPAMAVARNRAPPTALAYAQVAETVAMPERVEASSSPVLAAAAARKEGAGRRGGARTLSPRSKVSATATAPAEPSSPPDDIDFGI